MSRGTYPRFGRTMEWDTAAGDAIFRAAGSMKRTWMVRRSPTVSATRSYDEDFASRHFVASGKAAKSG